MKTRYLVLIVGLLAASSICMAGEGGPWDVDMNLEWEMAGLRMINYCTDPPQLIELTDGVHKLDIKARKVLDGDGTWLEAYDLHRHENHMGAKGIGYDLVVDENGDPVKPYTKVEVDGEYVTTEYSIPGTFNINQRINKNNGKFERTGTFMCILVSHGSAPNAMFHWNEHMTILEDGTVTVDQENAWCKCVGAGPEGNGEVDCDEFPDACSPTPF